jgi:DNA (cytosine-5)-methyltransferase 1
LERPLLLDLFCGAGGAARGYEQAGFEIVGIDLYPQKHYPYEFYQMDALDAPSLFSDWNIKVIHASPPCQRYSDLAKRNKNADQWPDLIPQVRKELQASGLPYVIENVEGAPLIDPLLLCGVSFKKLRVIRHRLFESNIKLHGPEHQKHPLVFTKDKRKNHYGKLNEWDSYVMVNGGGNCSVANARDAMGINWMTKKELNEAIPPQYTKYIGEQLMRAL